MSDQEPRHVKGSDTYTPEIADQICRRMMEGESVSAICRSPEMPCKSTVFNWLLIHKDFEAKYRLAVKVREEIEFDEILHIADTPEIGEKVETNAEGKVVKKITGDMIEHRKLRYDARRWRLARMNPKKYGERVQQDHTHDNTLKLKIEGGLPDDVPAEPDEKTDKSDNAG